MVVLVLFGTLGPYPAKEKAYKIARAQLGAWKINTQNMCKNTLNRLKVSKRAKNCTTNANNFEKCEKKKNLHTCKNN